MSDKPLTAKQELFAQCVVGGKMSASDAYRAAYAAGNSKPNTVHRRAHELVRDSKVAARIAALREEAAEAAKVTLTGHLEALLELRVSAAQAGEFGAAVRAELDRYAVSRRLPELQAAGHVRRLAPRVCTINGRPQCTWGAR